MSDSAERGGQEGGAIDRLDVHCGSPVWFGNTVGVSQRPQSKVCTPPAPHEARVKHREGSVMEGEDCVKNARRGPGEGNERQERVRGSRGADRRLGRRRD
jgi:hypothetical protein